MYGMNKKNIIIFIILASLLAGIVIFNKLNESANGLVRKDTGSIDKLNVDITLENISGNSVTYNVSKSDIEKLDYINYKMGLSFGNDYSLKRYLKTIKFSEEGFFEKYGYARGYYKYKNKSLYLLSKFSSEQNFWSILLDERGDYKLLKLADISNGLTEENELSFALKIEKREEGIYIYLESGLYILDDYNNITSIPFDANKVFKSISDMELIPSITRIEYLNDKLYIISTTENFVFYLLEYDIKTTEIHKYKLNYIPQCITSINDELIILSTKNNLAFIESLKEKSVVSDEIIGISNLNLNDFLTQTSANKLITESNNLYFILSNNKDRDQGYIFNVEYSNLKLKGFKNIDLSSTEYYLNNTLIYIK